MFNYLFFIFKFSRFRIEFPDIYSILEFFKSYGCFARQKFSKHFDEYAFLSVRSDETFTDSFKNFQNSSGYERITIKYIDDKLIAHFKGLVLNRR